MEKIELNKWYRHRGNRKFIPERVALVSGVWVKYDVVVRDRDGMVKLLTKDKFDITTWQHRRRFSDIMAYKFVEKK